jgi:hypothetical protein
MACHEQPWEAILDAWLPLSEEKSVVDRRQLLILHYLNMGKIVQVNLRFPTFKSIYQHLKDISLNMSGQDRFYST